MISTLPELLDVVKNDRSLSAWTVGETADHHAEITDGTVVVCLLFPEVWKDMEKRRPHILRARAQDYSLLLFGTGEEMAAGAVDGVGDGQAHISSVLLPAPRNHVVSALVGWGRAQTARYQLADTETLLSRAKYECDLLVDVGRSLSQQRDLDALLSTILTKAREVTGADAGSVYVIEPEVKSDFMDETNPVGMSPLGFVHEARTLRFALSQNDSRRVRSEGFTMPVAPSSIVGACVLSSEVINIGDLYALDRPGTGNNPRGFVQDRQFDRTYTYQTRSMLTVPMISARDEVIGVIQLINKRTPGVTELQGAADFTDKVTPFDPISVEYATTLASQAGIALENSLLYDEVRTLFEGFVRASVTAIESRDPTTSGHSGRVADLTVELARVVDRADDGHYADFEISRDDLKQIQYAALLHDFGKVGVKEPVLLKAEKLYAHERELVKQRFGFIRKTIQNEHLEKKVAYVLDASREKVASGFGELEKELCERLEELDEFFQFILKANKPSVLEQGGFERIADIATRKFVDIDGNTRTYLSSEEATALQIPRGSLTGPERLEIESHVRHTFEFLQEIPWGRAFRDVPQIAGAHHEKLDGSGYPYGLKAAEIPAPAKMMTISDIFDALTASDRPYKKAVPLTKALDILASEVKRGKLDEELYDMFLTAKVYTVVTTT